MNIDEIRKNKPEGATHYDRVGYYLKHTDNGWLVFSKLGLGWSNQPFILSECEMELYGIKPL
ncbi:hypothetical protein Brutus_00086 [Acinetobacter phage Brutus]|nr:hypothetical protein Brutus_00086 [Acinetobacter phage Brutus]